MKVSIREGVQMDCECQLGCVLRKHTHTIWIKKIHAQSTSSSPEAVAFSCCGTPTFSLHNLVPYFASFCIAFFEAKRKKNFFQFYQQQSR